MSENKLIKAPADKATESVFLPRISGEENTVFVGLNGKAWQIPRGKKVDVPACVAHVLNEADNNARIAGEYARKCQEPVAAHMGDI